MHIGHLMNVRVRGQFIGSLSIRWVLGTQPRVGKCLHLLSHLTGLGAHFKTHDGNTEPETWAERCYVVFCTDWTPRGAGKLTWGDPCVQLPCLIPPWLQEGFHTVVSVSFRIMGEDLLLEVQVRARPDWLLVCHEGWNPTLGMHVCQSLGHLR